MIVRDAMSRNVITIDRDARVRDACEMLADNTVGCLIAMNNGVMCGILTERDVIKAVAGTHDNVADRKVSDIMTNYVITVRPDLAIERAVALMLKNKIKKLPVLSAGKVVGVLTVSDVIAKWNY